MNGLMHLERWIEQLVEEPFVRLFAGRLLPQEVARRLVRALEDGERLGVDGVPEVPGRYRIELNPDDLTALLQHHPNLEARLTEALGALTERMDIRTHEAPAVVLAPSSELPAHEVQITPADRTSRQRAAHSSLGTQDLKRAQVKEAVTGRATPTIINAYLIIKGERTVDLTTPIVRVGRALDNDVILEDYQVSRYHAQLRRRYGRYILQDLDSSGGTSVNGFSIQEIVLRPGDLISLSGVDLIYGESEPLTPDERGHTRSMPPVDN